jgi:acyl-CoA synthetase (AMP-forming)/AMP-acid ligase II
MPKGVALTHANMSANIEAFGGPSAVAITPEDIGVSWLPLNHDMGLVGMALGALYAGRPCVLLAPHAFVKRPVEWLRAIARHRGTVSFAPAFAYDLCVRRVKDPGALDLSSWRVAGCGAEPIDPGTLAAFSAKFAAGRIPVRAAFCRVTAWPSTWSPLRLRRWDAAAQRTRRRRRVDRLADRRAARGGGERSLPLVSCGSPLPGHRLRIAAEDGRPLPERHVGEILLAGPSVMQGYYKERAVTAETIRDGMAAHRRSRVPLRRRAVCLRPRKGPDHRQRTQVSPAGPRARGGDARTSAARTGGGVRVIHGGAEERVVIVVEPSGTVAPGVPAVRFDAKSATSSACMWTMWRSCAAEPSAGRRAGRCSAPPRGPATNAASSCEPRAVGR